MSEFTHTRRRGGSFRLDFDSQDNPYRDDDSTPVQFITPYYESQDRPEPLDLSRLKLDNIDSGYSNENDQEDDDEEEAREELIRTRGRSRSRSIHANDVGAAPYLPQPEGQPQIEDPNNKSKQKSRSGPMDRSGPLPHREVAALQKGLEEATQSYSKTQTREDEEERMAADAEKRKRMLAAATHCQNNQISPDSEPSRRIKLLLLGDSGVGKSSLILRWTLDTFSPSMISTVGVNFKTRKIILNNELVQVQVWDTAGQEQFHKITTSYYKGAQGIMLVYDVSEAKSLENVQYWIKNIKSHASDSVQVVLVGNKIDLRSSESPKPCVDTDKGKEIARKFSVPFFETSAKESSHVDEAFVTLVSQIIEMNSMTTRNSTARLSLQGLDHHNRKLIVEKLEKHDRQLKELDREAGDSSPTNVGDETDGAGAGNHPFRDSLEGENGEGHAQRKFPKFSSLFHSKGGTHNSNGSASSTESTESSSGGSSGGTSTPPGMAQQDRDSKSPADKEKCVIS